MKQIDEGKDCILTRGGLIETPSTLGNPFSNGWLNGQKSAEVIVPCILENVRGRTEQLRRNVTLGVKISCSTDNPEGLIQRRT